MSRYIVILLLHAVSSITADWIKLPSISPTSSQPQAPAAAVSHSHDIPRVVFKLAPPPLDPDILSSETMSSVFFYRPTSSTTELPTTKKVYIKRYFQTSVTSKPVTFPRNVTDLVNRSEFMEPVMLQHSQAGKTKTASNVKFFNKSVAMNVIPPKANQLIIKDEINVASEEDAGGGEENDDDDDGVTVGDDDEEDINMSINSSVGEDEEYYYDDDVDGVGFNKFTPPPPPPHTSRKSTTSTTEMPKTHKKSAKAQNPQRRMMMQMLRNDAQKKPFPSINFPAFVSFIKKIQESFAMRTAKTIGEKIRMLMGFRDRLMLAINHQIKRLWVKQPRVTKSKRRGKRTLGGGGGGGWMEHGSSNAMDFPSAEGALLSICFLTFAVFLIKLVLQVIHTIKMKKAMWATQMMMGGTDNVVIKRRSERDTEYHRLAQTLDSIHNLKVH